MKVLAVSLCLFLVGFFAGRAQWDTEPEIKNAQKEKKRAITLADGVTPVAASTVDLMSRPPKGGKHTRAEMLSLLEEADRTSDSALHSVVLREWAKAETEEGIRAVFAMGNRHHAWQLLGTWTQHDPETAAQIAFSIPSENRDEARQYANVISASLSLLLKTDPEAAVELESQYSPRGNNGLTISMTPFDKDDTATQRRVLNAVTEFRNSWIGWRVAEDIFRMGNLDPEYSVDWINQHLRTDRRASALRSVLSNWMTQDKNAAGDFVASRLDGSRESRSMLQSFIEQSGRSDPKFLVAWLREQDESDLRVVGSMSWNYLPPQLHANLREALGEEFAWLAPKRSDDHLASIQIPKTWPPETTEQVDGWLKQHRHSPGVGPTNWTIASINEALALKAGDLSQVSPGDARTVAAKWAAHDPVAAIEWAAQLPDHLMIETAETALAAWFKNEPTAALEYVEEMPVGEFRSYAVERVSKDWLGNDAEAAVKWINDLPGGFDKDIARREAANRFISNNPKRSYFQSNWISNDVIREETLERVFKRWMARNPAEALEYIPKANLEESVKGELQNHAEKSLEARDRLRNRK